MAKKKKSSGDTTIQTTKPNKKRKIQGYLVDKGDGSTTIQKKEPNKRGKIKGYVTKKKGD